MRMHMHMHMRMDMDMDMDMDVPGGRRPCPDKLRRPHTAQEPPARAPTCLSRWELPMARPHEEMMNQYPRSNREDGR